MKCRTRFLWHNALDRSGEITSRLDYENNPASFRYASNPIGLEFPPKFELVLKEIATANHRGLAKSYHIAGVHMLAAAARAQAMLSIGLENTIDWVISGRDCANQDEPPINHSTKKDSQMIDEIELRYQFLLESRALRSKSGVCNRV